MATSTQTEGFADTLSELLKARHPIVLIESIEESRVLDEISSIAADPGRLRTSRTVKVFTLTNGLHTLGAKDRKAQAPDVALRETLDVDEPTVFVFHDLHHFLGAGGRHAEPVIIRCLRDISEQFRTSPVAATLVIIAPAANLPPDLEKAITVIGFPLPDQQVIRSVLDDIITTNSVSGRIKIDIDDEGREKLVKAALGLTQAEAENAFARAIVRDGVLSANDVGAILEEKRQTVRKSGLLEFMSEQGSIDDVGGLENLKRWLVKRESSWLDVASDWGLPFPKGMLITGVPGCGKSLTAKCSASLWGLPLLRLDVGRIFSGLVGSSEQNMRSAIQMAEAVSPSILWMDEIEKGFSGAGGGDSGTSQRVFGTFLTWMQEKTKPVFVIATANDISKLPPEFLRKGRFDEIFFVDLPTYAERVAIWQLHLRRGLQGGAVVGADLEVTEEFIETLALNSEGFSGAEIEHVVTTACFDAFADRRPMRRSDLERATKNTVPLSVTQAEKITSVREWAETRAVSASIPDSDNPTQPRSAANDTQSPDPVPQRGGRMIEF